jgi:hypothetical protein
MMEDQNHLSRFDFSQSIWDKGSRKQTTRPCRCRTPQVGSPISSPFDPGRFLFHPPQAAFDLKIGFPSPRWTFLTTEVICLLAV